MSVTCKTTAYGAGCGHPVGDHVGEQGNPCCCCNRTHNDPAHREGCLDCHIRRIKADHPDGIIAGRLAELLPEELRQAFWRQAVGRYLDEQDAGTEGAR